MAVGEWLVETMPKLLSSNAEAYPLDKLRSDFEATGLGSFETFMTSMTWTQLRAGGMLVL